MNAKYLKERARFRVSSETSRRKPYLVDLLEHRRQGWCDCPDFRIHIESVKDRQSLTRTTCKHIDFLRGFLFERVMGAIRSTRARAWWREFFESRPHHKTQLIDRVLFLIGAIEARAERHPTTYGKAQARSLHEHAPLPEEQHNWETEEVPF